MVGTSRPKIAAETRTLSRKSHLRSMRRAGVLPASIYGGSEGPASLQVTARSVSEYLRLHGSGSLLDVHLDGQVTIAVLREIDRDAVSGGIVHLAFQRVQLSDHHTASIMLRFDGTEELIKRGLVLQTLMDSIEIHGRADQLPQTLTIDVRPYSAGDTLRLRDIALPEGVQLSKDAGIPIAVVTQPRTSGAVEDEAPEATAVAA